MGTDLVGDFWLTLLIMPGARSAAPARKLLRCQILTENRTHHHIALGEEFPRRAIMKAAPQGELPTVYVRCWRCGAVAWLSDWMAGAELPSEGRSARIAQAIASGQGDRIRFLQPCDGGAYLNQLIDAFGEDQEEAST